MKRMATLQEELHDILTELRSLLACHSTRSVVGWCFAPILSAQQEEARDALLAPDRQISFLLAVLLSTPEPDTPKDLSLAAWDHAKTLLNRIYLRVPKSEGGRLMPPSWFLRFGIGQAVLG